MTNGVSGTNGANKSQKTGSTQAVSAKISEALKKMAQGAKTKSLEKTQVASLSTEDLQKELEQLQVERKLNVSKIEKYEAEVKTLSEEATKLIAEALKEQDKTVKEHEEKTQTAIQSEVNKYIEANKTKEGSMTKAQLASNISNAVGNPNLAKSLEKILTANQEIAQIDDYLSQINSLTLEIEGLDLSIANTNSAIEDAKKKAEQEAAQQAAQEASGKCCDPIGFKVASGSQKVQYDFIVDDGNFDSTSDFLGAKDQWESMKALDSDGDGTVTAKELKAGNIKAVKTDESGNKKVVDLAEEFGDDFTVNLNSYKSGGSFDGIDSKKDADGNGVVDQKLLGTFSVNIKGKEVKGYNTLDDTEFLKSNYGLKDDSTASSTAQDVTTFKNFFVTYTQKSAELKTQAEDAMSKQGFSQATIQSLEEVAKLDADSQAKQFDAKLKKEIDTDQRAKLEAEAEAKIQKQMDEAKKAEEAKKTDAEEEAKKKAAEDEEAKKKEETKKTDNK